MERLEEELRHFEARFGMKSQDFHDAVRRGDLGQFDALDDYRMEFVEWLALFKTWASLGERYPRLAGPVTPSDAPSWDAAG